MPRPPSIGVDQAYRTLRNAALFLGSALPAPGQEAGECRWHPKVIGNSLRELDRFLSILLDEMAIEGGWSGADLDLLGRTRNTPNKLRTVALRLNIEATHEARLRALGRCRDALFHCGGTVRRGDTRDAMRLTLGWPANGFDGAGLVVGKGDRLPVGSADLRWICGFYVRIGDSLLRSAMRPEGRDVAILDDKAHIRRC